MTSGVTDELAPGLKGHLAEFTLVRQLAFVLCRMLVPDLLVGKSLFTHEALVKSVIQVGLGVVGQSILFLKRHQANLTPV